MSAGEICDPRKNVYIKWKIPNYFSLNQKTDNCFESPSFSFCNAVWKILIWPNGLSDNRTTGMVSLYLELNNPTSTYNITFTLGIKCSKKILIKKGPHSVTFSKQNYLYGWKNVCRRLDLRQWQHLYIQGHLLTVFLEAKCSHAADTNAATQASMKSTYALCQDFEDLLKSELNSDVVFKVLGHTFKAHKLILETRSAVFAAMFTHEMAEKNSGIVEIVDCDPSTFQAFLRYMYTGRVENLTSCNVIGLFSTADKYCMKELKEQCVEFMKSDMSIKTVCEVIVVADKYEEVELKRCAEDLLVENIKEILPTDKWKKLLLENYPLGVKILMKAIPDSK